MKLLLDESVPRRLAWYFPEPFTLHTVQEMGWTGAENGLLLSLAAGREFAAFITVDRGIEHRQHANELPIPVAIVIAARNRMQELRPLVPGVVAILSGGLPRADRAARRAGLQLGSGTDTGNRRDDFSSLNDRLDVMLVTPGRTLRTASANRL